MMIGHIYLISIFAVIGHSFFNLFTTSCVGDTFLPWYLFSPLLYPHSCPVEALWQHIDLRSYQGICTWQQQRFTIITSRDSKSNLLRVSPHHLCEMSDGLGAVIVVIVLFVPRQISGFAVRTLWLNCSAAGP